MTYMTEHDTTIARQVVSGFIAPNGLISPLGPGLMSQDGRKKALGILATEPGPNKNYTSVQNHLYILSTSCV